MFVTKNRQKIATTKLRSGSVFKVQGKCSLRLMTPGLITYDKAQTRKHGITFSLKGVSLSLSSIFC